MTKNTASEIAETMQFLISDEGMHSFLKDMPIEEAVPVLAGAALVYHQLDFDRTKIIAKKILANKTLAGDEHMGAFVYCTQHCRVHDTGWCTVSPDDKVPLKSSTKEDAQAEYKTIQNIPSNLEECFEALKTIFHKEDIDKILASKDEKIMIGLHHTLGRHIRNEWGLWDQNSALHKYFVQLGLQHPDDMSGVILDSFWRMIHDKPLDLIKQIQHYKDYWERMEQGAHLEQGVHLRLVK